MGLLQPWGRARRPSWLHLQVPAQASAVRQLPARYPCSAEATELALLHRAQTSSAAMVSFPPAVCLPEIVLVYPRCDRQPYGSASMNKAMPFPLQKKSNLMCDAGKKRRDCGTARTNEIGQFGYWEKQQKPNHLLFERTQNQRLVWDLCGMTLRCEAALIRPLRYQRRERKSTRRCILSMISHVALGERSS